MISVNGFENEYVVDFNDYDDGKCELDVVSRIGDANIMWNITYVSDNTIIQASSVGSRKLRIEAELESLRTFGYIILKNSRNERVSIKLKPNDEAIRERNYSFKLGKITTEDNAVTFNIISKENGKNEPWSILYDGRPLSYEMDKAKTKLTLRLKSIIANPIIGHIVLVQDNSGKQIAINLRHNDSNSVEVVNNAEAG